MTRRCFSMKKGEMSTIIGESSSGNSWMLKNGKHVEKNHEDLSWEVADA
jgi:ABC-type polar amino acid transport system ATPase subunit